MRTESPDTPRSALDRLRSGFARLGTRLADQTPAFRWGLGACAIALVIGLAYASLPAETTGITWLESGRSLSGEHLNAVTKALDSESISYRRDSQGRVGVSNTKAKEAQSALAKHKVKIESVNSIFEQSRSVSIMDGPDERQRRDLANTEKSLQAMIEGLEKSAIETASVKIHRSVENAGIRQEYHVSVVVFVQTTNNRRLTGETVQSIQAFLRLIPDLKPTAVSLVDSQGYEYLSMKNPTAEVMSLTKAREEQLSSGLEERLYYIPGVKVTVRIDPPPTPAKAAVPPAPVTAAAIEPAFRPNQPIEIETVSMSDTASIPTIEMSAPPQGRVRVLVQVPRSFYLHEFQAANRRDPNPEELTPYIGRIRELVNSTVSIMVAPGEADIHLDMIPDMIEPFVSATLRSPGEERRVAPWWLPVFAMVAAGVVMTLVAVGARSFRRPALRAVSPTSYARFDAAELNGPGPSERVRDLIRRNPQAAAGVLQRWIGQGSHES